MCAPLLISSFYWPFVGSSTLLCKWMNNKKFCLAVSAPKLAAKTSRALVPHLTPSAFLFEEVTPFLCVMISPSIQLCAHADMLGGLDSFREKIAERKNAFLLLNMIKTLLFYTFCTIRDVVFRNRHTLLSSFFLNSTGNSPIVATFLAKLNKRGHFWNISKHFQIHSVLLTFAYQGNIMEKSQVHCLEQLVSKKGLTVDSNYFCS